MWLRLFGEAFSSGSCQAETEKDLEKGRVADSLDYGGRFRCPGLRCLEDTQVLLNHILSAVTIELSKTLLSLPFRM